jgi:hypothetical protein
VPLKPICESKYGHRNNFFRFKVENKKVYWMFMKDEDEQNYIEPYKFKEPEPRRRFSFFQGIKMYTNDKKFKKIIVV